MDIKKSKYLQIDKIFHGAYNYFKNDSIYSEEIFDVYKDRKEFSHHFVANIYSRVATGELLTISIDSTYNRDFIPLSIIINRSLGNEEAHESYYFDTKKNIIDYVFQGRDDFIERKIPTAPKFYIATGAACTSTLFLRSKKYDNTAKNVYTVFMTNNHWNFLEAPSPKNINIKKMTMTPENLNIEGHTVWANKYNITEDNYSQASSSDVNVWVSQHLSIPYIIHNNNGNKVVVKFLNNLNKED